MKTLLLILVTAIFLFFIGFLSGSFMLELTEKTLDIEIITTPTTVYSPHISLGFLLAFCSIGAGGILWAYSKTSSKYNSILVFSSSLLTSLLIVASKITLKLFENREFLKGVTNFYLTTENVNYFQWGYLSVLPMYFYIILGLLAISYAIKKKQSPP